MKKHPLLTAAAAAGTAVLYGIYRVAFYQKPTTAVPSPADMPTREVYRKAMCPDADALARDTFTPVHITAQDGTPLAARYYHHNDGAPLAIIFHGYRGYAVRDGLGGYTLCTKLGYNVLLPDQRAHGYSGGHTITMGVKERYDARDWAVWARSHFGPEVPIFLMGVSMGAATVLLAAGLNLPDNVCLEQALLGFDYCTPVMGTLTSDFGYREHPVEGEERFHYGIDIGAAAGTG